MSGLMVITVGAVQSSGREDLTRSIFSRRSRAAMSMLVPSEKVTMTMLMFSEEVEVSSSMPDTVAQADSIGLVTSSSTSSGPAPG